MSPVCPTSTRPYLRFIWLGRILWQVPSGMKKYLSHRMARPGMKLHTHGRPDPWTVKKVESLEPMMNGTQRGIIAYRLNNSSTIKSD